jgi:hypothetical protein
MADDLKSDRILVPDFPLIAGGTGSPIHGRTFNLVEGFNVLAPPDTAGGPIPQPDELPSMEDEYQCARNPTPVCPYCSQTYGDPCELDLEDEGSTEIECLNCERTYSVTAHVSVHYSSTPKEGWPIKVTAVCNVHLQLDAISELGVTVDDVFFQPGNDKIPFVLCTAQKDPIENGAWLLEFGKPARRYFNMRTGDHAAFARIEVLKGANFADSNWICLNRVPDDIVGTHPLTFVQYTPKAERF